MYSELIQFIRKLYNQPTGVVPLHAPTFQDLDREYVLDAIDSIFVSSIGAYVDRFEHELAKYTGAASAVATVNGTTALQTALRLVGVEYGDEVITQPLTFVATANAIVHQGGRPVFVDVDLDTMGLSPKALNSFLDQNAYQTADGVFDKHSGARIAAIVPMHTFGHPCSMQQIIAIASNWSIPIVEDAAEALGSWRGNDHCGTLGDIGILSFNGNKTITCGGGGAILTNDESLGIRAKHLTTTAKVPHAWEFDHDDLGYNFRMPNLNAALACAQLKRLEKILEEKRSIAASYQRFFADQSWAEFCQEPEGTFSNYWLCTIKLDKAQDKNAFLQELNDNNIMTRPVWKLMTELPMYANCQTGPQDNARWLRDCVVNLPSGVRTND